MANSGQIMRGIANFIDDEMINNMHGAGKYMVGVGMAMALKNGQEVLDHYGDAPWAKMIGLIDDHGEYNVAEVYENTTQLMQKWHEPIEMTLPVVGRVKLNEADVDKLYRYIMNA